MSRSLNALTCAAIAALLSISAPIISAPVLAAPSSDTAGPSSTATAKGITLRSESVSFPISHETFPGGARANIVNANCLICHSAGMVLTQPKLTEAEWQAEVNKMRNVYKAPIRETDVPAIVAYLATLNPGGS